jgi:predicted nuclease of restriction endonuclease-like (RecB) superfamily
MNEMKKIIRSEKHDKTTTDLVQEIRVLINSTRTSVAVLVNAGITLLYWNIGKRIKYEVLKGERADYGKHIVVSLSRQLVEEFGNSFSEKNLRRMIQFFEIFPDDKNVVSLIRELSWTHFLALIPINDNIKREFYIEMCRLERWSVRTLRNRIDSMLYERTALSKKSDEQIKYEIEQIKDKEEISSDIVLKDPYILDFLGLKDRYLEKDFEDAILRELENFILELGVGFSFIDRQKRITIDNEDFYIDLLFYNRKLKRMKAIELKIGEFKAEYKGQIELYLRWLDKNEKQSGEKPPLGIIMCAGKKKEQIELLELDKSGIHVAEYLTVLPPKEALQKKLQTAIKLSKKLNEKKK